MKEVDMNTNSNIQPFCLLNGKLHEQLFNYTDEELSAFHDTITPDVLCEVYDAVEEEHGIQSSSAESLSSTEIVSNYISTLSSAELETFNTYLKQEINTSLINPSEDNMLSDTSSAVYSSPKVEMLEGYIAISSSNLQALEKFKDRVVSSASIQWEHRIKKHGDVTIHSYVFNIKDEDE